MELIGKIPVFLVLEAFAGVTAFAQCHAPVQGANAGLSGVSAPIGSSAGQSGEEENRTVLVELRLSKSGAVRDARAFEGPTTLREAAIKALKRQKHKDWIVNVWPFNGWITAQVKFFQDNAASPEIRQMVPAGVSGCVHPTVLGISLPPEMVNFFNQEPILPTLSPKTEK